MAIFDFPIRILNPIARKPPINNRMGTLILPTDCSKGIRIPIIKTKTPPIKIKFIPNKSPIVITAKLKPMIIKE